MLNNEGLTSSSSRFSYWNKFINRDIHTTNLQGFAFPKPQKVNIKWLLKYNKNLYLLKEEAKKIGVKTKTMALGGHNVQLRELAGNQKKKNNQLQHYSPDMKSQRTIQSFFPVTLHNPPLPVSDGGAILFPARNIVLKKVSCWLGWWSMMVCLFAPCTFNFLFIYSKLSPVTHILISLWLFSPYEVNMKKDIGNSSSV